MISVLGRFYRVGDSQLRGRVLALSFGLSISIMIGGCTISPKVQPQAEVAASPRVIELKGRYERLYVLGPGDALDIVVLRSPEVSRSVVVRPDGHISLPVIDDVKAAGLTVPELDAELTKLFATRFVEPEVTVIPTTVREPMVYVLGQVARPGPVAYRQASSALEALAYAGGALVSAETKAVAVIRLEEDGKLRVRLIDDMPDGQPGPYMAMAATRLEPEDVVFVPERRITQFGRFITETFTTPIQGITTALTPYIQYKSIELLDKSLD